MRLYGQRKAKQQYPVKRLKQAKSVKAAGRIRKPPRTKNKLTPRAYRVVSSGDDKNTGTEKTETIDKSSEKESVKSEEAAETENVQKTDEKTEETESNQKTDEGNKTEETENNKKTDEDNKTEETTEEKTTAEDETKTTDTTNTETESITESTEISESTENAETEETTEESSKDNNEGDTTPAEGQVNVILHYKNSYGWSDVAAYFGKHNGEGWDGDALSGSWPGITGDNLQKDANGYYTVSCEIPKSSGFIIIFNTKRFIISKKP